MWESAGVALIFTGTALGAYGVVRESPVRCTEFFRVPRVLKMNNGFCPKRLLLNSMIPEHRFLLSSEEEGPHRSRRSFLPNSRRVSREVIPN